MFRDPGRAVHVLQLPRPVESMRAQWIGKLSQIIVQQQGEAIADVGKRGVVARRRICHSEVSNKLAGAEQLLSQVRIVKGADGEPALRYGRHSIKPATASPTAIIITAA